MVDVVGLGCCCFDLLGVVPHMPGSDEEIGMLETWQQGGGEVATALVTLARQAGVPVVLDADVLALEGDISEVLRRTDVLIASLAFAGSFAETEDPNRAIDRLLDYGPSVVLVTLGEQGCRGQAEGQRFDCPAFPVEVVDTTGAGDVFHGAYIYGMLQQWELMKTVEFASAEAAIKCTRLGGRTGIPDLQQALRFLRERNSPYFQTDGPEGGQP